MIVLVFRNDDLVYEYIKLDQGFFWRVVESSEKEITRKFVNAHELKKYFPWINSNTIEEFVKILGAVNYKNSRVFHTVLFANGQQLTKTPISFISHSIVEVVKGLKAMQVIEEHIKVKGSCKIYDSLSTGHYWTWDGDRLDKVSDS
jgi:hypothetical protein